MGFNEKYEKIKQTVQAELDLIQKNMIDEIHIREPLQSYLIEFLKSPSKHIRSVLALLYLKANNEIISDKHIELLTVVELVHNASLIHDDVIDESKLRRGHKTLSNKFDNKLAVISGDYILSVAMEKLTQLDNMRIVKKFANTIQKMCIGEINQNFDRFKIGTIENYIEKTKNKTAYLFETALTCSVMLSQNSYDLTEIDDLGLNIGIAFQIRDDLMNLTDTDITKPVHNDIEEGIYNAPVIFSGSVDVCSEGIEKTKDLLNNYIKSAQQKIRVLPDNQFKSALEEFLELLNNV